MPAWLSNIFTKIKDWWLKFTKRQRAIIVVLSLVAIIVFVIIMVAVSRPQYVTLITAENTSQTSQITTILGDAGIEYNLSTDALTVKVKEEDVSSAELALGASGYTPNAYTLADAQDSSLSDTTYDRTKRYQLYLETRCSSTLTAIDGIKTAKVSFHIPDDNGTLIAQNEEASAYIQLETDVSFNDNNAAYIAKAVASFLGNDTTANITILKDDGTLLFAGGDDTSTAGVASSMQELQNTAETYLASQVKKVLIGTGQYNDATVSSHINMDYATYERATKEYTANPDRTEGMKAHEETYESESQNGNGGVPGTDSNGEGTTYVYENGGNSSSSSAETSIDYLPNEWSEYANIPAGVIDYTGSSVSIAAISYKILYEEDAKTLGLLDGISWDEYKLANSGDTKIEVDQDFYSIVSTATGVPIENITIVAYESPIFYDKESVNISWTTVVSAALFILILALLIVVVLRSMGTKKEPEQEAEVSVEDLLQSNPEPEMQDIDVETKSETRKLVEKFVDENPEAAAALLRNWLNEDWG